MSSRKHLWLSLVAAAAVAGCATKPQLTPAELAKLRGGRTTVIAHFDCAPINYITGSKVMKHTSALRVDGTVVANIDYCGHTRFTIDSGQRMLAIGNPNNVFALEGHPHPEIFEPGATQYLAISQDGHGVISSRWVSRTNSEQRISEIAKVKPVF